MFERAEDRRNWQSTRSAAAMDSSQALSLLDANDLPDLDNPKRERSTDDCSFLENLLSDTTLAGSRPPLKRAKSDNASTPTNQTPPPPGIENCWGKSIDYSYQIQCTSASETSLNEDLRTDSLGNITSVLKEEDVTFPFIKVEDCYDSTFSDLLLPEQVICQILTQPRPEPTDDELYDHPADDVLYDPPPEVKADPESILPTPSYDSLNTLSDTSSDDVLYDPPPEVKAEPETILPTPSYDSLNTLSDTSSDDDLHSVDFTSDCEYDPPPEMPPIQSSRPRRSTRASARKIVATSTAPYPSVTAVTACTPCPRKSIAVTNEYSGPTVVVKTEPGSNKVKAEKSGAENDPRPYKCKVPGCRNTIGFKKPKHFYEHMRTVHSDGVMCPVPGCTARLSKASNVKRHLNEQHTLSASARAMYISAV